MSKDTSTKVRVDGSSHRSRQRGNFSNVLYPLEMKWAVLGSSVVLWEDVGLVIYVLGRKKATLPLGLLPRLCYCINSNNFVPRKPLPIYPEDTCRGSRFAIHDGQCDIHRRVL